MAYEPHHYIPLMIFGLVATPLSVLNLFSVNTLFAHGLAAMLVLFAGLLLVVGIVQHMRYS